MRLFLLFLIPLAFAQAPVSDVVSYNNDFNATFPTNNTINDSLFIFERELIVSSNITIAGPNLLLDNITHPVADLSLILATNISQGHLWAKPADGLLDFVCDAEWFNSGASYAWRCDFDNDSCAEYENRTEIIYNMTANFTLGNVSETVDVNSTHIQIPEPILLEMENASGFDLLNVTVEGNLTFFYEINDRQAPECTSSIVNYTFNQSYSMNKSIRAGGYRRLFFLRSPVLREQWFRNNQFNVIVFSQAPIEYSQITKNNESVNYTLRSYNITTNEFGLREIISNLSNRTNWSEDINESSPFPLELYNHSFAYIYQFNYSYKGLGENNLSLYVVDSFGNSEYYNETLLSRMLSYNNSYTETGLPINNSTARKSGTFEREELSNVEVVLGFLAVLVIILFVNFWIKK